jgi:hypothetical protein
MKKVKMEIEIAYDETGWPDLESGVLPVIGGIAVTSKHCAAEIGEATVLSVNGRATVAGSGMMPPPDMLLAWNESVRVLDTDGENGRVTVRHEATVEACVALQRIFTRQRGPVSLQDDRQLLLEFMSDCEAVPVKAPAIPADDPKGGIFVMEGVLKVARDDRACGDQRKKEHADIVYCTHDDGSFTIIKNRYAFRGNVSRETFRRELARHADRLVSRCLRHDEKTASGEISGGESE